MEQHQDLFGAATKSAILGTPSGAGGQLLNPGLLLDWVGNSVAHHGSIAEHLGWTNLNL